LPNGKACSADAQCQMGLCDRGVCARIVAWRNYGATCIPVPPDTPATETPEDAECFGYICMDGRCRSCRSDAECKGSKDRLTCTQFNDWPGKQCGKVIPGQVCPNGNPPAPDSWPHEGPEIVSKAPVALPDGGTPIRSNPAINCRTWRDF
jgi:hypothetical protein